MGLKSQLALIAVVTLLLPWAGCEFIRETELALRDQQQALLKASARNVAASLTDTRLVTALSASDSREALFLETLSSSPTLDGYANDWLPEHPRERFGAIRVRAGEYRGVAWVFASVGELAVARVDIVTQSGDGDEATWQFVIDAPGAIAATASDGSSDRRVRAYWQDTRTDGYFEARLPSALTSAGLGLIVYGSDGAALESTFDGPVAPAPIGRIRAAVDIIERYTQRGMDLTVVDANGWIRASASGPPPAGGGQSARGTFIERLYRQVLNDLDAVERIELPRDGRDSNRYVETALSGETASAWFTEDRFADEYAVAVAAAPIVHEGAVAGALVIQQRSPGRLLLTNTAMTRLATLTLGVMAATALTLLAFATLLSFRIRRLAKAADGAMDSSGSLETRLPSAASHDEIGSLSRSFSTLLTRISEYNDYLQRLAGRLSHELRTPLAVVTSSLDNLESESLDSQQREYAARAREGAQRLFRIVQAMSEATRVEQAASEATRIEFDLAEVVASAMKGYEAAYPDVSFAFTATLSPATVFGAPELLVQLLDKLVDNAASFSPAGGTIAIEVGGENDSVHLSVDNAGPVLPPGFNRRIFESLISVRADDSESHLGFGLTIARLIAEAHGGTLSGANRPDESGVMFTLQLPAAR